MRAPARGYDGFAGRVREFASDSSPSWPDSPQPGPARPNVVVMLVDDLGFSDLGPFGGEIDTPNIDRIAQDGWVFSDYHTAPVCSPSRASLMTGLNPHRAGFGYVAHIDPGYPGYACELPCDAPTLAESLRAGGYATFMVGKWHLTLESKLHDGADKSSWPLQRGFDRYFGPMDGFTSLHHPHRLIQDNSPFDVAEFPPGYFLTDDLTDRAVGMIDDLRSSAADKPFFLYYAHTSVHGPIQAKAKDIEKYRGRYAGGWERVREARFERQRSKGLLSKDAVLPTEEATGGLTIDNWDELSAEDQALFARHMEVYAAAVDEIDQSLGRLIARLEELGELENTIIVVTSDNGGSAEGGRSGTRSYFAQFATDAPLPDGWVTDVPRSIDLIGGPRLFSQYPSGWARVSNTPFRSFKSSTYEGGVHAPLVISWPGAPEELTPGQRPQFAFVSDLTPTILELTGVPRLETRAGLAAQEMDGHSLLEALASPRAGARREQYFECVGKRAFYSDGLKAVSPKPPSKAQGAAGGQWELYDLIADPTETSDLAGSQPDRVQDLAERWREAAWHNTVFPIDDDGSLHSIRPPSEQPLSEPITIRPNRPPLERFRSARLTVLRSFRVEAELDVGALAEGVILAHGDQGGGYSIVLHNGEVRLAYNAYGDMHRASLPIVAGRRSLLLAVDEQPGLHWSLTLTIDGHAGPRIASVPMLLGMAPFTGISVGYDYGGPVDWQVFEQHGAFPLRGGTINGLRYVPGARSTLDATIIRTIEEALAPIAD